MQIVKTQQVALGGPKLAQCLGERLGELLAVLLLERQQLGPGRRGLDREQLLVGGQRLASLGADRRERLADGNHPDPGLQIALPRVVGDLGRTAAIGDEQLGPQALLDLVDEGRRGIHPPDDRAERGDVVAFEASERRSVAVPTRERQVQLHRVHAGQRRRKLRVTNPFGHAACQLGPELRPKRRRAWPRPRQRRGHLVEHARERRSLRCVRLTQPRGQERPQRHGLALGTGAGVGRRLHRGYHSPL